MNCADNSAGAPRLPIATVAVSDCLTGAKVRWDGDDNGGAWPRRKAERLFRLVGVCPEVGIGMGVPREPIRLVGDAAAPRAVAVADERRDYTGRLAGYLEQARPVLDGVAGYIFADRSPSCGVSGVKVFAADGSHRRLGRGTFAAAVLAAYPGLPAVDAETLFDDDALREFALAVAAYKPAAGDAAQVREAVGQVLRQA